MKKLIFIVLLVFSIALPAWAVDGVVSVQSRFNVKETADRMESVLKEKGMTVFKRIKHSEAASKVGVELRDTELIIFGNPKMGSLLMKCQQSVAIDLPLKALIWEDGNAKVWISYNDPRYIEKRHNITDCEEIILKMEKALAGIAKSASTK
ncbi:DUF302 domain-containing protein [Desulfobacter hydrogenophilus]|uniref:DUF302 domain-containing protein n=1 Tax=Desulfobacter hydrogenophilus TaxID=2291 RepID=A0A328FL14_9BACT|nr:DUF302 domain-containing protein [Desulfobacter hydrogenophilus]NDY72314.1 DUF302 domain-containing protein [Desulfobacter hydrogenophilus]QBH12940.1 DUF302 domain-containing protein [Desulfobacter hydrogenophilus]RAM03923.1 DUF302 domain-containing protein [Desulfobacter hydrogenophilus]